MGGEIVAFQPPRQRRSLFACGQTIVMGLASTGAVMTGYSSWPWFWLAFTPLLLLRTLASIRAGLNGYKWLVRTLKLRRPEDSFQYDATRPLRLFMLGLGGVAVKEGMTLIHIFRLSSSQAIPQNFKTQTLMVDWFNPPELVPGA